MNEETRRTHVRTMKGRIVDQINASFPGVATSLVVPISICHRRFIVFYILSSGGAYDLSKNSCAFFQDQYWADKTPQKKFGLEPTRKLSE